MEGLHATGYLTQTTFVLRWACGASLGRPDVVEADDDVPSAAAPPERGPRSPGYNCTRLTRDPDRGIWIGLERSVSGRWMFRRATAVPPSMARGCRLGICLGRWHNRREARRRGGQAPWRWDPPRGPCNAHPHLPRRRAVWATPEEQRNPIVRVRGTTRVITPTHTYPHPCVRIFTISRWKIRWEIRIHGPAADRVKPCAGLRPAMFSAGAQRI